jgi:outer membrane protein OmpA-like peptidoglycan-associated protein
MSTRHPTRRRRLRPGPTASLLPLLGAFLFSESPAAAEVGLALHAEGSAAHTVGRLKSDQYGWGASGLLGLELSLGRVVGIELPIGLVGLPPGKQPPPAYMRTSAASAFFTTPGVRLRPFAFIENPWARSVWMAGGAGLSVTGKKPLPVVGARAGFDVPIGSVGLGPYASVVQIIDPGGGLSVDARIVTAGLHGTIDFWHRAPRAVAPPAPPAAEPAPEPAAAPPAAPPPPASVAVAEVAPPVVIEPPAVPPVIRAQVEKQPRFASGDASLTASGREAVERAMAMIAEHPTYEAVLVSGHADDVGSDEFNLTLSEQRARAVAEALVKRGVDRARIRVEAYGSTRPLRAEQSPEARRENRRVEIEIAWRQSEAPAKEEQR